MRITIGGILLVGGVTAVAVVVGPWRNPADLLKQAIDGVSSLVKSVSGPAVIPIPSSVASNNSSTPSAVTVPSVSTVTVETSKIITSPASSPVVMVTPAEKTAAATSTPTAVPAAPQKQGRHKHRRTRRIKTAAASPVKVIAQAGKKVPGSSADPLVGHYVSVKLKSGREVKGILRAKTSVGISLEIPGMGPFQYPSSNIDGI